MLSGRSNKRNLRASLICAFAFAGLMLLSNDQSPGHVGELFRATNKRQGRGLTVHDYERVLHRALASTADQMSKVDVDQESISRRALKKSNSPRSLTSDNTNYEIIKTAQNIHADNDGRAPFVFIMQCTVGMVEMIKSWICNTKTMEGVHESTLLIVDEPGKKLLDDFEPAKGMHIVLDSLAKDMQEAWEYGTLGYWLAVQHRFHTVFDIVELGKVPIMIIEPDAVWLENPLDDPVITDSDADIVGYTDGKVGVNAIGFGFLRMQPTDTVINLLRMAGESVDDSYEQAAERAGHNRRASAQVYGEQRLLSELIWSFREEHPEAKFLEMLSTCRYPSGMWYNHPSEIKEKCQKEEKDPGSIVVLQNNWIVGNEAKVSRAKEWGHWFLSEGEDRCLRTDLKIARQSVIRGTKPEPDDLVEEMEAVDLAEE